MGSPASRAGAQRGEPRHGDPYPHLRTEAPRGAQPLVWPQVELHCLVIRREEGAPYPLMELSAPLSVPTLLTAAIPCCHPAAPPSGRTRKHDRSSFRQAWSCGCRSISCGGPVERQPQPTHPRAHQHQARTTAGQGNSPTKVTPQQVPNRAPSSHLPSLGTDSGDGSL